MRFLSTSVHGYLDYIVGALLIAAPWIFNFANNGAETWVPVILGAGAILYSLMTDYELGVRKSLSMRTHLGLDLVSGLLLAVSPWLFGFAEDIYGPHLIFGLLEMGVALVTKTHPVHEREVHRHHTLTGH
ncbi:SPW repeat domain-containing protein [Paraflavisolibacter sp. H34]|uniref:SPW repeat domain-containing protein n=1 Tax=Huijunlia imazamoxiresistens TaxID=3127457 RepID=UPI00301910AE